jgi:WD40 repeat protein
VLVAKYTQLVEVWSVNAPEEPLLSVGFGSSGTTGSITGIAWSPDGTRFAVSGLYDTTTVYEASTGAVVYTLPDMSTLVAWSPDGTELLTGNASALFFWDAETGEAIDQIENYGAEVAAWSPDGVNLLVGNSDGTANIFDDKSLELVLSVSGHIGTVTSVDWSPNGTRFITSSSDGKAKIWDAQTGDDLLTLSDNTSALISADWSPDGSRVVTADLNGDIKIWNVWQTLDNLLTFAQDCCVVRDLTAQEQEEFGLR